MSLSKSNYLKGMQCKKALFLHLNAPEIKAELTGEQEARFSAGHQVGKLAQDLFPGGVDASRGDFYNVPASVAYTSALISQGQKVIYEACFMVNDCFCYLDILVKDDVGWKAYEVKGSTEVKEYQYQDAAFQYFVITGSGLPLQDMCIVHVNNQYVRQGDLEVEKLFAIRSVLGTILPLQPEIPGRVAELLTLMKGAQEPVIDIGPHCSDPFPCDFHNHCWHHVPEYSVFNILNNRGRGWELYGQGILEFRDIPPDFPLNEKQRQQVEAELNGTVTRDQAALDAFKAKLVYPLYFMDFETFQSPVPIYDGTRPYQFLVFQYSLHILDSAGGELEHREYLGTPPDDPREEFLQKLISDIGMAGSIVVYNKTFESGRLNELARDFPQYQQEIAGIQVRIVDLMGPFRNRDWFTPEMKGSYSIKKVLPALVPHLTYKNLEVQEGGTASLTYLGLYEDNDKVSIATKRRALLEYCKLDTLAMVEILSLF